MDKNIPSVLRTGARDPPTETRSRALAAVKELEEKERNRSVTFENLPMDYSDVHLQRYDAISWHHPITARVLASQLPSTVFSSASFSGPPASPYGIPARLLHSFRYVDLGCGVGYTADGVLASVDLTSGSLTVVLADGLPPMLALAQARLEKRCSTFLLNQPTVRLVHADIRGDLASVRQELQVAQDPAEADLVTAQRILLNVFYPQRANQLRQWKGLLASSGRLVLDVPHPHRLVGALEIRNQLRPDPPDGVKQWTVTKVARVVGEHVLEDCRRYARELAAQAGLEVVNDMPWHMDPAADDFTPAVASWINSKQSINMPNPLSPAEWRWFHRRYCEDAKKHYWTDEWRCEFDVAAVVVVLQPASSFLGTPSSAPPSFPSVRSKVGVDY